MFFNTFILLFFSTILFNFASGESFSSRLRIEYLPEGTNSIDNPTPKFSWALVCDHRACVQSAYQITVVQRHVSGSTSPVWNSGKVSDKRNLNIVFGSSGTVTKPLASDSDYEWTVVWYDGKGTPSVSASSTFSTAFLAPASEWQSADWVAASSSVSNDNIFRANFTLPKTIARARLYISGLGYFKSYINGKITDDHQLGGFTTFQYRTNYESIDITDLLVPGCNILGVALGHGWYSQPNVHAGPRQLIAILSLTDSTGATIYLKSSLSTGANLLNFFTTQGPVVADDIYAGETYDGRIAAALQGWSVCGTSPQAKWTAAAAPSVSPRSSKAIMAVHTLPIRIDTDFTVYAITQPASGQYVYDFYQNMAGFVTLRVNDCPVGTIIKLQHAEILYPNGSVHNHYDNAPMLGTYICSGQSALETYTTQFTYYGFRYVQIDGYPGVPHEGTLMAHFVHSDLPKTGEFSSSSPRLNAIQHATRYAAWSNLQDIPTDCPQRERFGWLGDAQLSFETQILNADGGAFYTKWLQDFADTQKIDNATMDAKGALPDCVPFYGHGHTEADPGWGIAGFNIPLWFASYYDDTSFEASYYPGLRWYIEHWISLANGGLFPIAWWGDWAEFYPGPYDHRTVDYADFHYLIGLKQASIFAENVGAHDDATRYTNLFETGKALYLKTYYNPSTKCFADCMYVSQIFGLSLDLFPVGSDEEAAVWAHAMTWFTANGTNAKYGERFGGGIIALKLVYPILHRMGLDGLGLRWQLATGNPSFGQWIDYEATTLWEAYPLTPTSGGASYNHIMFGGSGDWYYKALAGLDRADGSRSWSDLVIAPPGSYVGLNGGAPLTDTLSWASASVDSPMGLAASSWSVQTNAPGYTSCSVAGENTNLKLECTGGKFTSIAFVSFGTPTGSCNSGFKINSDCNASSAMKIISSACIGKSSCSIDVSDATFGDPCPDIVKVLAVALTGNCTNVPPMYLLSATVPGNGVATISVPLMSTTTKNAVITEGSSIVWKNGAFVSGVPGISGAQVSANEKISFSVGSGSYSFQLN